MTWQFLKMKDRLIRYSKPHQFMRFAYGNIDQEAAQVCLSQNTKRAQYCTSRKQCVVREGYGNHIA